MILSPVQLCMTLRRLRTLLFLLLFAGAGACPLVAQANLEYDVKSAFLYNFIRFIVWPEDAFADPLEPFVIGVLGREDPFNGQLEAVVRGKTIDGRPLEVRFARRLAALEGTHILYISPTASESEDEILAALAEHPVVTVGETAEFTAKGGIIRFFVRERKVAFEINPGAAERAGLRISSRLLSLADVYQEPVFPGR